MKLVDEKLTAERLADTAGLSGFMKTNNEKTLLKHSVVLFKKAVSNSRG